MISIICCTMRENFIENVFLNYENQVLEAKELIVILNKDDMEVNKWKKRASVSKNVSVYHLNEKRTLGECLNYGIKKARYNFIAKFDDDDYYAPKYLEQSMILFEKTNADLIGKTTVYMYFENEKILSLYKPGKENKFVDGGLRGATLIFKKEISKKVKFPKLNLGEDSFFVNQCFKNNFKLYSANRNNYVCLRFSKKGHHTWKVDNNNLLKRAVIICRTEDYKNSILQ